MTDSTPQENLEPEPPRGHVRIVYLGPVAPHWEIQSDFGDGKVIDGFRQRVNARLVLLPPHDPQFRRNRERVNRDAERENLLIQWDLGVPEDQEDAATSLGDKPTAAAPHAAPPPAPAAAPHAAPPPAEEKPPTPTP